MTVRGQAQRDWTAREEQILQTTLHLTARQVADMLPGRSEKAVAHRRSSLGLQSGRIWTAEEDAIVRDTAKLTAQQASERLSGRSATAVHKRRAALGIKTQNAQHKLPTKVGDRTLLAKTCCACGLLLDGSWFLPRSKTIASRGWASRCRKCAGAWHQQKPRDKTDLDRMRASHHYAKRQGQTLETAVNNRKEWTDSEDAVLSRADLTVMEKALILGRTYNAVVTMTGRRGYLNKRGLGTPEELWIIRPQGKAS